MQIQKNISLKDFTSFGCGGNAEELITITDSEEVREVLQNRKDQQLWLLGHGTNVLISDSGLPGTTLRFKGGKIAYQDGLLTADAGISWDDLVLTAIEHNLWGIEHMSGVPGSVGSAVYININAYGQAQADSLLWVEVYNTQTGELEKLQTKELEWGYKKSIFQNKPGWIILRAAYQLSPKPTSQLEYRSALDVAEEMNLKPSSLKNKRAIILETRKRAGSLFRYAPGDAKTVGSFFRNPFVTPEQAALVMSFEETGRSLADIKAMNQMQDNSILRVSASHVLLAAGFKRGQQWGSVRLHPEHVLKIENIGNATAQEIYNVATHIVKTVKQKLNIELIPEASFLGKFLADQNVTIN